MSKIKDSILECIPKKTEKFISFSLGGLRFIDSLSVLQASLDSLVKNLPKETFEHIKELAEKKEHLDLFYQKGVYPYEYLDSWKRLKKPNCLQKRTLTVRWMMSTSHKLNTKMQRKCGKLSCARSWGITTIYTCKRTYACWRAFFTSLSLKHYGWIQHTTIYRRAYLGMQC